MTVLVGVVTEERVVLGADTNSSTSSSCSAGEAKVFSTDNGWLCGVAGSYLLTRFLRGETLPVGQDRAAMYALVDAWMGWCRQRGYLQHHEGEQLAPAQGLIATAAGELWRLQRDGSIVAVRPYCAVGAGEDIALGALSVLWPQDLHPHTLVAQAVEAAIRHSPWCGGTVQLLSLPRG